MQNRVEDGPGKRLTLGHFHSGEEIMLTFIEGELEYQIEGSRRGTVKAGEALMVPAKRSTRWRHQPTRQRTSWRRLLSRRETTLTQLIK